MNAMEAQAVKIGETLGRKFQPEDLTQHPGLIDAAESYARRYTGSFDYMRDMNDAVHRYGHLTRGQAKGTLNCLLAEARRNADQERAEVCQATEPSITPGTYTIVFPAEDADDYLTLRVKPANFGDLPAGTLTVSFRDTTAEYGWTRFGFISPAGELRIWSRFNGSDYDREIHAAEILTSGSDEDRAAAGEAYALRSGKCWHCGRKLTVPTSIHRGLGPDCAKKLGR